MATPIIPNLIQDMTPVIYQHVDGLTRYRLSMVSTEWHTFCNATEIVDKPPYEWISMAVNSLNILCILKYAALDDLTMRYACIKGNMELIDILIRKGNCRWTEGLIGACVSCNSYLVIMMMSKIGHDYDIFVLENALWSVCAHDNGFQLERIKIIQLLLYNDRSRSTLNRGLRGACRNDNIAIVQLLLDNGADDYDGAFANACGNKCCNVMKLLITIGATYPCLMCNKSLHSHIKN